MCENCPSEKELRDYIKTIKPCDGFVHKCSCDAGCVHYTYKIINPTMLFKRYFCRGERMSVRAMKWIIKVGCYTYRCDDGNNTE